MKTSKEVLKRLLGVVLTIVLVVGGLPPKNLMQVKAASEVEVGELPKSYNDAYYDSYEDAIEKTAKVTKENEAAELADGYIDDKGEVVDIPRYNDYRLAADYLRKCMVERRTDIVFDVKLAINTNEEANSLYTKILLEAMKETPNSYEGDYMRWHVAADGGRFTRFTDSYVRYELNYNYISSYAEEEEVTKKVKSLLKNEFKGWETHKDSYNAKKVYSWLINNFEYDHSPEGYEDHSAYGGFFYGTTVCQGYATAAYRLLKEMGVDNRLVASKVHGWNLVKIGSKYYSMDATWGDQLFEEEGTKGYYDCFLVTDTYIKKHDGAEKAHTVRSEYATPEFRSRYPLATRNYTYDAESQKKKISIPEVGVKYQTHVQSYGWESTVKKDGQTSGTTGQAKRLEAISIALTNTSKLNLGVEYKTHIQSYGWETSWKQQGNISGTTGQAKRLEAIRIRLTGEDSAKYDIFYRVHSQTYGWLGWAKNGEVAGTSGQSKRLEGIQIVVVKKGQKPSGIVGYSYVENGKYAEENSQNTGLVNYQTHVQSYGWQNIVCDGSLSGTTGEAKRLEGIKISVDNLGVSGGIMYQTHVQTYGWMNWVSNGALSGTTGQSKRLEAIRIKLTGKAAEKYDVYYRVHAQTYGWMGWAKNGQDAGTSGMAKRLEGIQIVLLPKGSAAPSPSVQPAMVRGN